MMAFRIFRSILIVILCFNSNFAQSRQIAITIDDLPVVSKIKDHIWLSNLTDSLLFNLKKYKVPATGFVIKNRVLSSDSINLFQLNLLKRWIDSGLDLGNHTYSHPSLNKISSSEYIVDIAKGDEIFNKIKPGFKPAFFRHPFLHTGRDSVTRSNVEKYLHNNNYTIAPVTIDNSDYIYAQAYENAIRKNDLEKKKTIARDYVTYMQNVVEFYEKHSKLLIGREIKQILLLHSNKLNADLFDELAEMLLSRGYRFIPLREALTDPAYKLTDNFYGAGGISWIHRWALTQGKRGEYFKGEPEVSEFVNKAAEEQ